MGIFDGKPKPLQVEMIKFKYFDAPAGHPDAKKKKVVAKKTSTKKKK